MPDLEMAEPLSVAIRPLVTLATTIFGAARRLYQERSAGLAPVTGQTGPPQLNQFFDDTLSRLSSGNADEGWWRNLLDRVGHTYVAPAVLQREDLQSWLKDDQVRVDFKALAGARIVDAPEAPEIRARLQERYAAITNEPEYLTNEPIEVVVAILLAAFVVDLGPVGSRVALLTLESDRQTRAEVKEVARRLENVGPDRLVEDFYTRQVLKELALIQQRRAWEPAQAREQSRQLLERIQGGDLRHADRTAQSAVLCWAARLHASQPEHLAEARSFRDRLRQLDPAADTRIVDALILETEGDAEGALRVLRDVHDPDAQATFFSILHKVRGRADALGWFDNQERRQDPYFLTGLGWSNIAVVLAQADRWEEATAYLARADHAHREEWPDLLFLEGVANAALLLPSELRQHALDMNLLHPGVHTIEGLAADRHRERAIHCFQQAEQRLAEHFSERALGARRWLLWLRLTHPDPAVNQAAREEVQKSMENPEQALSLLSMARAFGIPFDVGRLRSVLDQRERWGGLEEHELQARFMLAEMSLGPADLIAFLDEEEAGLRRVVPAGLLSMARIEALLRGGQAAKARNLLEEHSEEFVENDRQRLEAMIDEQEGQDPLPRLKELYESAHKLIDLQNLVQHLHRIRSWSALRPYLEELFRHESTLPNALHLVACLQRDPGSSEADILRFLENNQYLAAKSLELTSAKAWALFHSGRLDEARALNERLRSQRSDSSDLQLEINLALQSGAWESFAGIVEREWERREELDPEELIRLASLAAEAKTTSTYAFDLLRLAAEKGRDDPQILTAAIGLAYRLGREGEELRDWLAQAAALSSSEGPIKTFDLRTLVEEWMPAHRERRRTAEEHFLQGSIPLHIAAGEFNVPLSSLLIGLPHINAFLQDGRRRTVIPIVSGARQPVLISPEWNVGLDITSLMILSYLGLLGRAIESVQRVILAPDTMLLLLNERNRVRFHQPSLVEKAEEVLGLIGSGQLRPEESLPSSPHWLTEEVGADLAQLLQAARANQGYVVWPRPIHKAGSLDEEARIRDYEHLVVSTVDFELTLYDKGILDARTHEKAARFLRSQDLGTSEAASALLLDGPLYLADLGLSYLQSAGLLKFLANSGLDLRIHPSTEQDQISLIERSRQGEQLEKMIEDLRVTLRNALHAGRVGFLRRHNPTEEEKRLSEAAPTLGQFLQDAGPCDAVCIDDRFLTKSSLLSDRQGKVVPVICVFDVLRHLEARGLLAAEERQYLLHRLRQSGFVFVHVEAEELKRLLTSAPSRPHDPFVESAELRIIRQTLARVRSLAMLRQPGETAFIGLLCQTGLRVISQLWDDEDLSVERAAQLTDWVWRHVVSMPSDWEQISGYEALILSHLSLLFQPLQLLQEERQEAFLDWLEKRVLEPLAPANGKILDRLAELVGRQIEHWSGKFADDKKVMMAKYMLSRQPPSIGGRLERDEALQSRLGVRINPLIGILGKASMKRGELFEAARVALARGEVQRLLSLEGEEITVSKREGSILLQINQEKGEPLRIPFEELGVLSSEAEQRLQVLDQSLRAIGPTGLDFSALRHAAAERELTDEESGELLDALWHGVAGAQARLRDLLRVGKATVSDLVPDSLDYFERFCGPDPGDLAPEEYLGSVLPKYRKRLLQRDLKPGLEICLSGTLRDDLCPGAWLEEVGDDDIWEALEACQPQLDPFSLLGALDIALYRQHDERFRTFAEEAVAKLTADQFPDANGLDLYQLLPSLAQLVLNRIHLLENGALRAPLWKRMCAWMQASMVIRLLAGVKISRHELESRLLHSGQFANLLDFRREPMAQAGVLSPPALRGEVVGRLLELQRRHQALPRADDIQAVVVRLTETSPPLCFSYPGPLEGHRRPEVAGNVLAEEIKDRLIKLPADHLLNSMVNLSQLFHFDEETRSLFRETISKRPLESYGIDLEERLSRLAHAGIVAAAERDRDLAQAIAEAVLALAPSLQEGSTDLAVQGLLIASAAFEEEGAWAEWLKEQLSRLAGLLPAGKPSSWLYHELQELKKVTKLHLGITSRAEALASAAASFLE